MKNNFYKFIALSVVVVAFIFPLRGDAASINLSLTDNTIDVGGQFAVDIHVDSEGASINAAKAVLKFVPDILEVVNIDKTESIFNFWLEEPAFSNSTGEISFIGGSISGYSGKALDVLRVIFRVKKSGTASLTLTEAAITAADGSGKNVLSTVKNTQVIGISLIPPEEGASSTPPPVTLPEVQTVPPPKQIVRAPTPARNLPIASNLDIPMYPDGDRWYNIISPFLAKWNLPDDITDVATAVNKSPSTNPVATEGLFDNKFFSALDNGIWYLHVRLKNALGWGKTAHRQISIDAIPPTTIEIEVADGSPTENPKPTITFKSNDQLSGLSHYYVKSDIGGTVETKANSYTFEKALAPGKHLIIVGAADNAGNNVEDIIQLEILPIAAPSITFVSTNVFVAEGGLTASGTALPDTDLFLSLKTESGQGVYSEKLAVDGSGHWAAQVEELLKKGTYYIEIVNQDSREASSLPIKSDKIVVRERPLLTIFGYGITQFWFFTALIILLILVFIGGIFSDRLAKRQRERKILISMRDVGAVFGVIKKDVQIIVKNFADDKINKKESAEIKVALKRLEDNLEKFPGYVEKNIKEIE